MKILIDPTHTQTTTLEIERRSFEPNSSKFSFAHAQRDCGAGLIQKLKHLELSAKDQLKVIVGPGNFTAVRTACLVGNALNFLTGCRLFTRRKTEKNFKKVTQLEPYYAQAPSITPAKQ
ncbi:MAG: hypothetical protein K9L85_00290 [Candidatus Peribacteraceae bacterium]|nr:hypothetical protein [Candidatus Peribacteraceae bacterium]